MKIEPTRLLTRSQVAKLLSPEECIAAVENAFRLYAEGKASPPGILGIHASDGGFHTKAGILNDGDNFFVSKTNANFPGNHERFGLPTIQGVIVVSNADNGTLLCVMDSIEITILRTGAATAVAAKYLSRADASTVMIWGCGNQGRISAKMLSRVRKLKTVYLYDVSEQAMEKLSSELKNELTADVISVKDPLVAVRESDIVVTCTTSKKPFLGKGHVRAGTFVAAVGADSESKHELEPSLLKDSKVIVDLIEQSALIGDLHHALESGVMNRSDVFAELGEIVCGKKARPSDNEIVVFDSTGMALQDVAASSIVFKKAVAENLGLKICFSE